MIECQFMYYFNTSCIGLRSKIIINFIFTEVNLGFNVVLHDS